MVNSEGNLKLTFDLLREAVKNAQREEGGGLKFVVFGILHNANAFYYTVKTTILLTGLKSYIWKFFFCTVKNIILLTRLKWYIYKTFLRSSKKIIFLNLNFYTPNKKCFCPALTKLALDLHVNFCLSGCILVFPVSFFLSKRPSSFCLIHFGGGSGAARGHLRDSSEEEDDLQ